MNIIVDINNIYTGNMLDIKDWIFAFNSIGVDAVTINIDKNKDNDLRITEREIYTLKAFCDLANIKVIPEIKENEHSVKEKYELESYIIDNFISLSNDSVGYQLYIANKLPIKFPTFNYMNYLGFIDNTKGINASIIALCKGAKYIIKGINGEEHWIEGFVEMNEIKSLCEFRNDMKRILLGIKDEKNN